ncbi:site-specific integrase [Desulfovibrio sp. JC010]|uniref:tyrosine-type recombinase/integrase n=1 Tax=Desulfovibrio sp. JC010 TaxID=2593641 RepID=UPI0013D4378E|nr:site-specific integrase [Desulfovibrio sp. JC010]NDV27520.1 site-specific integrase [Desulfovibrio sp. JC010]
MAEKKQPTSFRGVRFRPHQTRRHGVRKDRDYFIRYTTAEKKVEESVGWSSEGMTAEKASIIRNELIQANKLGRGPRTLKERRDQETRERAKQDRENVTFSDFFHNTYYPQAQLAKAPKTHKGEFQHVRDWIAPVVGDMIIKEITPDDLAIIVQNLNDKGRSKRTIQHVLSTFRIVWNHAKERNLASGDCPRKAIKLGKIDNERTRFLKPEEVKILLEEIASRDTRAHDLTLAAVNTGARLGELSSLTWRNVDLVRRTLTVIHTKTHKPRTFPMTDDLFNMLSRQEQGSGADLVFPNNKGEKWKEQPWAFRETVKKLGFNDGIESSKERLSFHNLRHTAATLMLIAGVDIRTLQDLFGWSTTQMAARYTHTVNATKSKAVEGLGRILSG